MAVTTLQCGRGRSRQWRRRRLRGRRGAAGGLGWTMWCGSDECRPEWCVGAMRACAACGFGAMRAKAVICCSLTRIDLTASSVEGGKRGGGEEGVDACRRCRRRHRPRRAGGGGGCGSVTATPALRVGVRDWGHSCWLAAGRLFLCCGGGETATRHMWWWIGWARYLGYT